jgi:hypothetical protein
MHLHGRVSCTGAVGCARRITGETTRSDTGTSQTAAPPDLANRAISSGRRERSVMVSPPMPKPRAIAAKSVLPLFLIGALVMTYNLWRTMQGRVRVERAIGAPHVTVAAE